MFKVAKYPHGHFSWADCNSRDTKAAKEFYAKLMGWETNDMPLGDGEFYTMFTMDDAYTAGLGGQMPEMRAAGVPSHWTSYVSVDDADAVASKVESLGGTVMVPPMDIFDSGRMALIVDPTGAQLGLWQPQNHNGAGIVNTPGAMGWNELSTRDSKAARDFYGALFGWTFEKVEDMEYHTFSNNGRMNGGIMQLDESWGDAPPNWMVYFSVADIDATIAKATELGGTVHMPKTSAGDTGDFAIIADPAGAACAYIQLNQPQPWDL